MPHVQILVNLEATNWSWNCDLIMFAKNIKLDYEKFLRLAGVVMLRWATAVGQDNIDVVVLSCLTCMLSVTSNADAP
jgi:hypothetical protein